MFASEYVCNSRSALNSRPELNVHLNEKHGQFELNTQSWHATTQKGNKCDNNSTSNKLAMWSNEQLIKRIICGGDCDRDRHSNIQRIDFGFREIRIYKLLGRNKSEQHFCVKHRLIHHINIRLLYLIAKKYIGSFRLNWCGLLLECIKWN